VLLPRAAKGALVRLLQQARPFGHPALLRLGRLHAELLGGARKAVYTPIAAACRMRARAAPASEAAAACKAAAVQLRQQQ
jgi:hypothetical protein